MRGFLRRFYKERKRRWIRDHPGYAVAHRTKTKIEVLSHYCKDVPRCVICSETRLPCLSIDHINGGGNEHRKQIGATAGHGFYEWLRKNNFPSGYQVLCMNCQFIKQYENNECKKEKWRGGTHGKAGDQTEGKE